MTTIKQLLKLEDERRFYASLVFFLLLLVSLRTFAADITVSLDRNPVSLDESFQIIFTANESPDDDPDFTPLAQDFSILNQSNSSSASWVNGKSSKTVQWTLNVMPKQTGSLVIPAIKFGKDASESSTVLVTDNAAKKTVNSDEELYIEVEATPLAPIIETLANIAAVLGIEVAEAEAPALSDSKPFD